MQRPFTRVNLIAVGAIVLAAALFACNPSTDNTTAGNDSSGNGNGGESGNGSSAASFELATAPEGEPVSVADAVAAEPGDDVIVVRGRIKDAVAKRMSIQLADESLHYCGQTTPEACGTPWDFC